MFKGHHKAVKKIRTTFKGGLRPQFLVVELHCAEIIF
jgi:hypothetical protein